MVTPLEIKSQGYTDFCTGCVISSIAEQYVGETCDESYSFAAGKKVARTGLSIYGVSAKFALLGAIRYGVLPKKDSPYGIATQERDFLANWDNWSKLESFATKPFKSFKKISVSEIEEYLKTTTIFTGIFWQSDWSDNYLITTDKRNEWNKLSPHEVRIIGSTDDHFIIQNSRGPGSGKDGLFYLPKQASDMIDHCYVLSTQPWPNIFIELLTKYIL